MFNKLMKIVFSFYNNFKIQIKAIVNCYFFNAKLFNDYI